jgi:hypothetical protein
VDNDISIELYDNGEVIRRRLLETDVVISGSTLTTIYYDVINTSTGEKMVSNDIDVYILPRVRRMYINGVSPTKYAKMITNIIVDGKTYQFINFAALSKKNVYAFYDFDICRGAIHFTRDGLCIANFSDSMMDCINTGYSVIGFHTHEDRVKKYASRGLGICLVPGCRVVPVDKYYGATSRGGYSVRGLNAVRNAYCDTCKMFHLDNREKIHLYGSVCKSCLAKNGFRIVSMVDASDVMDDFKHYTSVEASSILVNHGEELWFCGKTNNYHIIAPAGSRETPFGKRVIAAAGLAKYPVRSHKIVLPVINVSKMSKEARKYIIAYMGITEERLSQGTYMIKSRKYALNMSLKDPVFDDIRVILSRSTDDVVYKARVFMANREDGDILDLCLKVSVYIPAGGVMDTVIPVLANVAGMEYKMKDYIPFVTHRRYKKFGTWAKPVTRRSSKTVKTVKTSETSETIKTVDVQGIVNERTRKDASSILESQESSMFDGYDDAVLYSDSDEE